MFEVMQAKQVGSEWHVFAVSGLDADQHMDGPYQSEAEAEQAAELIAEPSKEWLQ
jgi:hypothetical protein